MSCNNCGKYGHTYYQCKMPIISNGIIAYRKHPETKAIEYLMIRRRDTLGMMDFIRGKYSVYNKYYIMNMIFQMTDEERTMLLTKSFDEISMKIWNKEVDGHSGLACPPGLAPPPGLASPPGLAYPPGLAPPPGLAYPPGLACPPGDNRHKTEETISREKFNQLRNGIKIYTNNQSVKTGDVSSGEWNTRHTYYSLESMINECKQSWTEQEWGFPKGKRNYNESDIDCALREFYEETGFKNRNMAFVLNNIAPYEEIFMGSNYKPYKHRYFLMYVDYNASILEKMTNGDTMEISKVEWKPFTDGLNAIRSYNLEKKRVLSNVNIMLTKCTSTIA